jgi:hypothetical protein
LQVVRKIRAGLKGSRSHCHATGISRHGFRCRMRR